MDDSIVGFIIVSDLFERYTVILNIDTRSTSVYCEECEQWVNRYEGEKLSKHSATELLEIIVEDHSHQVRGTPVEIADSSSESLI